MHGWIGVDLDGTLMYYGENNFSQYEMGEPIPLMVQKVKDILEKGYKVKIFTARANVGGAALIKITYLIQDWLEKIGLPRLGVTCKKDYGMIELWDDRCRQVKENTIKL